MPRIEKTVFISYRRSNVAWALAIYQDLARHGYDVFFDFTGIASGDFESVIVENIRSRAHFVVVLTPSALERCDDPLDWVRREIETALDCRRNIVPLMLDGFNFSTPSIRDRLTGTLAALKDYNALSVPVEYFGEAMNRLRDKWLNVELDAVRHPLGAGARAAAHRENAAATAAQPTSPAALTAAELFERGTLASDSVEKIRLYTEAIRLNPSFAVAYCNRGNELRATGDPDGAIADCTKAINLAPTLVEALNNRGNALADKKAFEAALADFNEAIRLDTSRSEIFNNRGTVRRELGDIEGALADHTEAIRLRPNNAEAYNNRGYARQSNPDVDAAFSAIDASMADYSEAIRINPDLAVAYYNRGILRLVKGDQRGFNADRKRAKQLGLKA